MREVSCRVLGVYEHAALAHHLRYEDLVADLPVPLARLRDRREWIDWELFVEIVERFEHATSTEASVQAGRDAVRLEVVGPLQRIVGASIGLAHMYRVAVQWQLPLLYRNVQTSLRKIAPNQLELQFALPPHFRGSEAWFRSIHGALEQLPAMCGLPPAQLEVELSPSRGLFRIALPAQERSLFGKLRALVHDPALKELERQVDEIRQFERERALVDAALHEREQMLSNLIANLSGMVYRCRADDWTFTFASDRSLELTGYPADELISAQLSSYALVHPDDVAQLSTSREASLATRQPASNEYRLRTRSGEFRRVLDVARGVYDEQGALTRVEGFITDVSASRAVEEELSHAMRVEGIGRLAGGIAHDFNNLLGVILGAAELARLTLPLRSPARDYTDQICGAAERAAALTKQLLAFARKQAFEPRIVNLNELVLNVDKLLRRTLLEHIELVSLLSDELWPVAIDVSQFEQVLVNLAINARDAMPSGGTLTIETANIVLEESAPLLPGLAPGLYVMLSVTDTGFGMTDEVQARAFEPFFTTKGIGKGTGLGLASSHGIVRQAHGQIFLMSELGRGTTLRIYLPRASGEAGRLVSEPPSAAATGGARESVLVVEDHEQLRALVARTLAAQGYRVQTAASGVEALEIAAREGHAFDLLLTDVVMPHMSGFELADRLRAEYPNMPVLYVSGFTGQSVVREHRGHALGSFLAKPFTPSALTEKVRAVLERARTDGTRPPALFLVR